MKVSRWILPVMAFALTQTAYAVDAAITRTYVLTNLHEVVSDHSNCKTIMKELHDLQRKPLVLEYISKGDGEFVVNHEGGLMINHTYKIVQEMKGDETISRTGMGSFELNHHKMDYVLQVTADLKHEAHQFIYPMIITNQDFICVYTAFLKPDRQTISVFKRKLHDDKTTNGADLIGE